MERSIVEYFGEQRSDHCGYCKKGGYDKYSHGMWCHSLTVRDYQDLMDRGWRRSGKYCYKPTMDKTCCPQYTIRCDALSFKPTRGQKKVMKRVSRFLKDGTRSRTGPAPAARDEPEPLLLSASEEKPVLSSVEEDGTGEMSSKDKMESEQPVGKGARSVPLGEPSSSTERTGKDRSRKAKEKRKRRRIQRLTAKGIDPNSVELKKRIKTPEKSLEDFLVPPNPGESKHQLTLRLVRSHPPDAGFLASFTQAYKVYWGYQTRVHGDPPDKPSEKQYRRFLCESPLILRLVEVGTERLAETLAESYGLFRKYQMGIHGDPPEECDRTQWEGFLVETPLIYEESSIPGHPGYGSFHQQYLLDGKIIAVGVVDILPECVSSKYLYYDPEYAFLTLGTYSALREIGFVRELAGLSEDLKFYYMGFYVHNCPKMKYKGRFSGSYLLCPEAYTWEPFQTSSKKLDVAKYSRMNETDAVDVSGGSVEVEKALVLFERTAMPYSIYQRIKGHSSQKKREEADKGIKEYSTLVGQASAYRILLYRE